MSAEPDPEVEAATDDTEADPGWPWSFLLLVAAGGIYLVLRFFQMAKGFFD